MLKRVLAIVISFLFILIFVGLTSYNAFSMNVTNSFYMISKRTPLTFGEVAAIAHIESRGNPNAISPTGAKGLYQFTSYTWKSLNVRYNLNFSTRPSYDIYEQTIMMIYLVNGNIRYMNRLKKKTGIKFKNNVEMIYMAHNIGAWNAFKIMQLKEKYTVDYIIPKWILKANRGIYKCGKKYCTKKQTMSKIRRLLNNSR